MNRLVRALTFFAILIGIFHVASCSPDLPNDVAEAYADLPDKMDYNLHVKPILSDKCFSCHGPDMAKQQAGLRLDLQSFAFADLPESPGKVAIDPGDLNGSELFHRILSDDPEYKMPSKKSNLNLSATEKAILIKWIREGAEYKTHWAFVKPEKAEVPTVKLDSWVINPIDNFIVRKLEIENLQPSSQAKKELLLRRLSLDLTGLPPTLAEIAAFVNDRSPEAYEKQVDRLLKSPHYGEKMAVNWLDLARFADSHGYTVDRLIDMSPYRDWVIQAYNKNMPYDQFVKWQLAGDLMPNANKEMKIATAFNRLHQQNLEGGIIEEEFQAEYVIDRVNTTGIAVMGLPIGCARCHDHKYDPISQKNYYEMFSFFNRVKEAGQISWDDATPSPTILLPSKEQERIIKYIDNNISKQENKLIITKNGSEAGFRNWIKSNDFKKLERELIPLNGLQAHYTFSNGSLKNSVHGPKNTALKSSSTDKPVFEKRDNGNALVLNGDQWFDLNQVGVFRKSEPFSINISVFIPKEFKEGVIFHKCVAERLYNFRGYHLYLKDNKLTVNMSHAAPSNAISRITQQTVPRNQWVQLTMTYDGSSKAKGLKLFQNGTELRLETTMDQLSKDILMNSKEQPGLQIGAWDRGLGFKGGKVDDIMVYNRELTDLEIKILAGRAAWSSIVKKTSARFSDTELSLLKTYYSSVIDPEVQFVNKRLTEIRTELADSTEKIRELMVMQDSPQPKKTYLLKRGNYDSFGEEVFPNTPESILPFPGNLPKNRLGLAQWLTDEDHPLTARVSVNRYWQNFFGTGLVKTSEDFGNQGELPSHPELLDWLAVTYRESGWDNKKLCKLIVMSATYRQDSRAIASAKMKDPENRFLSHGPAQRMSAEMIRDNALMASGLLNKKIGGKSVKPYQPDGLWEINNTSYKADSGDAVYRRSLYVLVKRSVPNPTLNTFDATTRSYCVVRRQSTNTPLQSLVLLNDPTFVEASKVMGQEITSSKDTSKAISDIYSKLTGIRPGKAELDLLKALQSKELQRFRADIKKTKGWLSAGQFKVNKSLEPAMVAANSVVASVILNSDATLTKR
ncbi:Planctomycete cytochrome C [Daejeonella rubra]|uniref:Planctomycete cytochrome C n=1 Tax=Daejeonella rubra TaxID=990371 RepID=A0A1G9RZB5_9SPHI|nr:DUF1553 domain-containing protein [Daejeonella rubra]SDM28556.1 Planctomycete cytochrome C [Daejeonella rubra]